MENTVSKVAAIHDLSGFGRSSLAVVIPILSVMGIQVCSLPTAVLSTQTGGFEGYCFIDLTDHMEEYIEHWHKLGIEFACIYSGFLGSSRQIDIIARFIDMFSSNNPLVVIDPVLGDDGRLYETMDQEMVARMRGFIKKADIITPNFTEAAFLLDEPYNPAVTETEMKTWLVRLSAMGPKIVVITSVPVSGGGKTAVLAYNQEDGRFWKVDCVYLPADYPGTGDAFTSVIVGSILQGDDLPVALSRGVRFITAAIQISCRYKYPEREGVLLEKVLDELKKPVPPGSYELMDTPVK